MQASFYPTTVVLVHEGSPCLALLASALPGDILTIDPGGVDAALKHMSDWKDAAAGELWSVRYHSDDDHVDSNNRVVIEADLSRLLDATKSALRFSRPSVALIDWDACGDAMSVLRALAPLPVRKVILAGRISSNAVLTSVTALAVDEIVSKFDPDFIGSLSQALLRQQERFFDSAHSCLRAALQGNEMSFVGDPGFEAWFSTLRHRHNVAEYYVSADPCGVLMIDDDGRASMLLVATEAAQREQLVVAKELQADPHLLALLQARSIVAWFPGSNGFYRPAMEQVWKNYVWSASAPTTAPRLRCAVVPASTLSPHLAAVRGTFSQHRKRVSAPLTPAAAREL